MDYEKETRSAYRNELKAKEYHEQYIKGKKWARFTMWRQRRIIEKIINQCDFQKNDWILDIPCGTGFIGEILCKTKASIVAADISIEMMQRAQGEYMGDNFKGFVQCDITQTPFRKGSFNYVVLLAFMHRLPIEIRQKTWEEIVTISNRFVIVNYSLDSRLQRLKQFFVKTIFPDHIPAPSNLSKREIINEIKSHGLAVKETYHVAPLFSAKIVLLLEKK